MREAITNQVRDDDSWNKGSLFAHLGKHEIFTPINRVLRNAPAIGLSTRHGNKVVCAKKGIATALIHACERRVANPKQTPIARPAQVSRR
jgi:hypothetical protein